MVQINGPAISVWISWIVIILTSQDTWSHVSLSTVEIWYILEGCTKWSPGTVVMYSNRLCWPTPGCIYSWFIFEGCRTFKWDIKWQRRLKHCWLCGITGTFSGGVLSLFLVSFFFFPPQFRAARIYQSWTVFWIIFTYCVMKYQL